MRNLEHVKHVIIKIGSTSLCNEDGQLDKERILKLIQQIAILKRKGLKVTLVSSGAISSGMGVLNLSEKPKEISKKQALAAIGQAHLMQIYEDLFSLFHLKCAQILLNHDDFDHRKRLMNLSFALSSILDYDVIPIINENDTLAVDEIKVGDNDTLSALLLPIVDAQLLVLVSDIDGLYNDNPHTNSNAKLLSDIELVDDKIMNYAKDSSSQFGTGGMVTKLRAAKIVNDYGGDMAIVNGNNETALIDLLEGKTDKILKELDRQMQETSSKLDFEKAAELRDRKLAIERASSKQKVSNISENNIDVIGLYKSELEVCIEIFFVRGSKMIGREHYFFLELKDMEDSEILSGFIKQYYLENPNIPSKIMLREELPEKEVIEQWLSTMLGKKVELKSPKKGEKLRFVEMAENNAKVTLENKEKDKSEILMELKDVLKMEKLPRKIETFDISNISGEYMVAGMCVMQDGVIKKNLSRRFKIKTVIGQDDPKCMEEVVTRRIAHSIENPDGGFGKLPDAFFADGGITQIRPIKTALKKYNLEIPVFGMVKNDKHQTRALMDENRNELEISENLMNLITKFQDTVHDTAISYHRKLREKSITKSELDEVKGIGDAKKKELLKQFGSVGNIKNASIEELIQVKGINENLAKEIKSQIK